MLDTATTPARKLTLKDLPLVSYRLGCGHEGSERAILPGDTVFCPSCTQLRKVATVS